MKQKHRLDHEPFLVRPGKRFRLRDHDPAYTAGFEDREQAEQALLEDVSDLAAAQDLLWATARDAVIVIFQAMDAAGKDGTIKHVMSGVNPQGVSVISFKAPNEEERVHHFLWRPMRHVPGRGRIAIFNRSYYEEVLVVRVHPEFLEGQGIDPLVAKPKKRWPIRYEEINRFERIMLNGHTQVIKFFLHVSKEEQRQRFLARLEDPKKNWKFSPADVRERAHWDDYMEAYQDMLAATSTERAPWYVIPADHKWFMRAAVADIIAARIKELDLEFPEISPAKKAELEQARRMLLAEGRQRRSRRSGRRR